MHILAGLSYNLKMTSLNLKIIACVTMLIDHIGFLFFPHYMIFRIIGRIAFPIFAFLIAEGFLKTKDVKKYIIRLSVFAVISQAPFYFLNKLAGVTGPHLNILITLVLGIFVLLLVTKVKNIFLQVLGILAILAFAYFFNVSYGVYGILSIVGSYVFLKNRKAGVATLAILPFIETARLFTLNIFFLQFFASLSLIPIYFYNGQQGMKISRWWFYWFYPIHMAFLCLIFVILK